MKHTLTLAILTLPFACTGENPAAVYAPSGPPAFSTSAHDGKPPVTGLKGPDLPPRLEAKPLPIL